MNHLAIAKTILKEPGITLEATENTRLAINLAIAHALIALVEANTTNSDKTDYRLSCLEDFKMHSEDCIENIENRQPVPCPTCGENQRFDFSTGWSCLNLSCDRCLDDIPF